MLSINHSPPVLSSAQTIQCDIPVQNLYWVNHCVKRFNVKLTTCDCVIIVSIACGIKANDILNVTTSLLLHIIGWLDLIVNGKNPIISLEVLFLFTKPLRLIDFFLKNMYLFCNVLRIPNVTFVKPLVKSIKLLEVKNLCILSYII